MFFCDWFIACKNLLINCNLIKTHTQRTSDSKITEDSWTLFTGLLSLFYKINRPIVLQKWFLCNSCCLYQLLCVVRVLKKGTAKRNLGSVLLKFELERSYFGKLLDPANFCHSLHHVSSVAFLVAEPWRYRIRCVVRDSWPLNLNLL